jgi:catechol 2,3-dioxygenase-like lactoylglutathione lyase family enzyme
MTQRFAGARLAYANIMARDIVALARFYSDVLGFPEIVGHRSPIYRCLDAGGVELGFNAPDAYALLNLSDRKPVGPASVGAYVTFEVPEKGAVDAGARRTAELGGSIIKPPYETYYNGWQTVLADPEQNVFRINHRMGPREPHALAKE